MNEKDKIISVFSLVLENGCLKKTVFSKATDKNIVRAVARIFAKKNGESFVQLETFTSDNKARHKNLSLSEAPEYLAELSLSQFLQTNIVCAKGECEIKISKKGKIFISDRIVYSDKAELSGHNREKNYILDKAPFLEFLGICNQNGKIIDKKQSKFRQINRFVELLDDVYDSLPSDKELLVCDLCCGKSYLTFAVYYYLTEIKKRKIKMYGVDLKRDVIEYCSDVTKNLGYTDLEFICDDISNFDRGTPDLVISLHACDIATDIVLGYAINHGAKVILSTPCCHHEMMKQLSCDTLSFISDYSMLKQKLCDAATDSLRCLMLSANGYSVEALELIDPDDTPKNLLIRAVLDSKMSIEKKEEYRAQYKNAVDFLGVNPFLSNIVTKEE
ncbi:MAG: SAM-dependent methyltransferase [Ruminococcaceae bacterium]|nr:SAM-dependent methyltransferase [Oscillospiraceae bacterium]